MRKEYECKDTKEYKECEKLRLDVGIKVCKCEAMGKKIAYQGLEKEELMMKLHHSECMYFLSDQM